MQYSIKQTNSYTREINIKESAVEVEKAKKHVIENIRKNGKVKGFKKGSSIPDAVIIREYGEESIKQQSVDHVLNSIYPKILKKENIVPVAQANITDIKSTEPLELTMTVEVFPEVKIDEKKLDKIQVARTPIKVDDKEVDAELESIKERFTHFHEAGHHAEDGADTSNKTIEKGDRATISAQGYDKKGGEAIKETAVPNYPLVIGSGNFIPGFEEELIGAKVGDEVAFDITFPKDYHADEFKGRKVHFTATIEKLEKPHTPEFTPEFIEQLRGQKTDLKGFKEILRGEIKERKEREARNKDEDTLMKEMLQAATIEVGPGLLQNEIEQIYREHAAHLEEQGLSIKNYLEHIRQTEADYKEQVVKPEALRRLQAELLLREIRQLKKIEPTDAEVSEEIEKVISQYSSPDVVARLKEKLVPGDTYYEDIKNRLAYRKVVDRFWK